MRLTSGPHGTPISAQQRRLPTKKRRRALLVGMAAYDPLQTLGPRPSRSAMRRVRLPSGAMRACTAPQEADTDLRRRPGLPSARGITESFGWRGTGPDQQRTSRDPGAAYVDGTSGRVSGEMTIFNDSCPPLALSVIELRPLTVQSKKRKNSTQPRNIEKQAGLYLTRRGSAFGIEHHRAPSARHSGERLEVLFSPAQRRLCHSRSDRRRP